MNLRLLVGCLLLATTAQADNIPQPARGHMGAVNTAALSMVPIGDGVGFTEQLAPPDCSLAITAAGALGCSVPAFTSNVATVAGTNDTVAWPIFTSTHDTFTSAASKSYFFELRARVTRVAGTTSHALQFLLGGTATYTAVSYTALTSIVASGTVVGTSGVAATATTITSASTSATEANTILISGVIRVNGAGTIIPQFKYTVAPGGVPTVAVGTWMRLTPIGTDTIATFGAFD